MKKEIFANLIKRLTEIEPNSSPVISCFVNLEHPRSDYFQEIEHQAAAVAHRLGGAKLIDFEDALEEIREYLSTKLKGDSKSVVIYSRWGEHPVFLPMQFQVPLETAFIVDELPHIYPLIELKDVYHRFVVAILADNEARILETTIGSITEDILAKRPDLRERVGKEWTKEHYHSHSEKAGDHFISEKIEVIDRLMERGGHNHLILAGAPKMVAALRRALPHHLKLRLIDTMVANPREDISPILAESMKMFVATEDIESHNRVNELEHAVLTGGLGVCGIDESIAALQSGSASMLVLDQDMCDLEHREELVRLAVKTNVPIETVNRNETMYRLGGVGCLLRYLPVEAAAQRVLLVA